MVGVQYLSLSAPLPGMDVPVLVVGPGVLYLVLLGLGDSGSFFLLAVLAAAAAASMMFIPLSEGTVAPLTASTSVCAAGGDVSEGVSSSTLVESDGGRWRFNLGSRFWSVSGDSRASALIRSVSGGSDISRGSRIIKYASLLTVGGRLTYLVA